jgi:hypothetical protein
MPPVFLAKHIKAKKLSPRSVRGYILSTLNAEGRHAVGLLNLTVATWEHERPTMDTEMSFAGGDVILLAGPTGNDMGVRKWEWLDKGTRVRYATMSTDWQSKTRIRQLKSGQGKGHVVARGRRAGAHKGIQARMWSEVITKMMSPRFKRNIMDAVKKGLRVKEA